MEIDLEFLGCESPGVNPTRQSFLWPFEQKPDDQARQIQKAVFSIGLDPSQSVTEQGGPRHSSKADTIVTKGASTLSWKYDLKSMLALQNYFLIWANGLSKELPFFHENVVSQAWNLFLKYIPLPTSVLSKGVVGCWCLWAGLGWGNSWVYPHLFVLLAKHFIRFPLSIYKKSGTESL